jgi:UPF0755 protein
MRKEIPKIKLIIFLGLSMLMISFTFYFYQVFFTANVLVEKEDKLFVVEEGSTFRSIQQDLRKGGYVNDIVSFSFVARLMKYDTRIKPGRYLLKRNMNNQQAVYALTSGRTEEVKVIFTHVRLISDLGERITANIGVTNKEFYDALDKFIVNNEEGFTQENILTMFIPNTYMVYFNVIPDDLINRFNKEYHRFWTVERLDKARSLGLTPIEVSILASIVQAEISEEEEGPIVAGLYLNRLKKDIPLQADPTLVFATGDFTIKRVLNVHKEIDSPYNTYKYTGLPPGPINMPYISSIDAVLNHKKHDYLYMCAREDFSGFHNFASTMEEHLKNARRYQRALTAEQKKAAEQKQN